MNEIYMRIFIRICSVLGVGLLLPACSSLLDLSKQTVTERLAMHEGPWRLSQLIAQSEDVPDFLKYRRDFFIDGGARRLGWSDADETLELEMISDQLVRVEDHYEAADSNPAPAIAASSQETNHVAPFDINYCKRTAMRRRPVPQFVGLFKNKYCVLITIVGHGTNIDRDGMHIVAFTASGPITPGIVVGGARPMSRGGFVGSESR